MTSTPKFQFHKGTIRTLSRKKNSLIFSYFNSIKVQLELMMPTYYDNENIFQFHKGTIRTSGKLHLSVTGACISIP